MFFSAGLYKTSGNHYERFLQNEPHDMYDDGISPAEYVDMALGEYSQVESWGRGTLKIDVRSDEHASFKEDATMTMRIHIWREDNCNNHLSCACEGCARAVTGVYTCRVRDGNDYTIRHGLILLELMRKDKFDEIIVMTPEGQVGLVLLEELEEIT